MTLERPDVAPAPPAGLRVRGNPWLRLVDRYAGIPLVTALGAVRRKRAFDPSRVRRIGLMKTIGIGDMVLLTAVARDVKAAFPSATLVAVSGADMKAVVDLVAAFDERVVVWPLRPVESVRTLRAARLDVLLDFGPWLRFDAALAALSGARFIAGFSAPDQRRHYSYDVVIPHSNDVHEIDNLRRVAAAIGVRSTSIPRLDVAAEAPTEVSLPYVVFHPWPGGYRHEVKEWPSDRWIALGSRLAASGYSIVLSGGPRDAARSAELAVQLKGAGVRVLDLAGRRSLRDTAAVCAASACVVTVNTGTMHIAAAVGARTVSLDGPTAAARWGPIGDRVRSVESSFPGCGYLQLGWEYDGRRLDCMSGIAVDAVFAAVMELAR